MPDTPDYIELAAEVVAAYVANNSVRTADLPALIGQIHSALVNMSGETTAAAPEVPTPAVPIKKSVTSDYIVCLEDGRKFKTLKRHLRNKYDMSPEQYRTKWGLPSDYPMVAPAYAKTRSALATKMGLGQQARKRK